MLLPIAFKNYIFLFSRLKCWEFFCTFYTFGGIKIASTNQRWQREGLDSVLYPWYYMSKRCKRPTNAICTSHPYAPFPFEFLNQFCPFWLQPKINTFSSNVLFCIIWMNCSGTQVRLTSLERRLCLGTCSRTTSLARDRMVGVDYHRTPKWSSFLS